MGLLKCEKETVIICNDAEPKAMISTSQDWMKERFRKLAARDPENIVIKSEDKYTMMVEVPKKYVSVRIPRKLTEEQKKKSAERLSKYWKNKKGSV